MTSSEKLSLRSLTVPASGFVCGLPATHTRFYYIHVFTPIGPIPQGTQLFILITCHSMTGAPGEQGP